MSTAPKIATDGISAVVIPALRTVALGALAEVVILLFMSQTGRLVESGSMSVLFSVTSVPWKLNITDAEIFHIFSLSLDAEASCHCSARNLL